MNEIQPDIVNNCLHELTPNNTLYLPYMKFLTTYIEKANNCVMEDLAEERLKEYVIDASKLFPLTTTYARHPVDYVISNVIFENDPEDDFIRNVSEIEVRPKDSTIDDTFFLSLNIAFDNFRIELPIKPVEYDQKA